MLIQRKSPVTGNLNTREINVTDEQMAQYRAGNGLIQHLMPQLNDDDRGFILTGMTPEDWETVFSNGA